MEKVFILQILIYGINKNFKPLTKNMYSKSKLSIRLPSGTPHYFPSSNVLKQGFNLSTVLFNYL